MVLFRLSTTYDETLEDDDLPGDRTLLATVDLNRIDIYSYTLNEPSFDRLK